MEIKKIRIEDYDYPLSEDRIALYPLEQRDSCKLLVVGREGKISHHVFSDLPIFVRPSTLIVVNETKVIRARIEFFKQSGARIEIFLLEPFHPHEYVGSFDSREKCSWVCLIGNKKRWKEGRLDKTLVIEGREVTLYVELKDSDTEESIVEFKWDDATYSFAEILEAAGRIPIPPYLRRLSEDSDTTDYQTVYSQTEGSVAAPTAGLHFTSDLLKTLRQKGDDITEVTLHVGAGTFKPIKSEEIGRHTMHTEWISVSRQTLMKLIRTLEEGRDVLAVGTTSVRTLETLPYLGVLARDKYGPMPVVSQWMPYEERFRRIDTIRALKDLFDYLVFNELEAVETTTSIMIAPGFRWRIVNRLITNFHQPKSTLLLLVSSFLGEDRIGKAIKLGENPLWRKIYEEAQRENYRFLSYGDACLLSRGAQPVELPLSKSMLMRAATIKAVKAVTDGTVRLTSPEAGLCDDAEHYYEALRLTLESVKMASGRTMLINIGEGAAPLRFLTAFAASLPGAKVKIECDEKLQRRPILPLIKVLREMGADIDFKDGHDWYIQINGRRLKGGNVKVDTTVTSQFTSALLMASPLWDYPMTIDYVETEGVSLPYLKMTEEMMQHPDTTPEPDWSAAAFFYEYALMTGKEITFATLIPPARSLQGDSAVCNIYEGLGVSTTLLEDGGAIITPDKDRIRKLRETGLIEIDFKDFPDIVPSLAVALCYCRVPFRFLGVRNLRYKECDRLSALQNILFRAGYGVDSDGSTLEFDGKFRPMNEFPIEIDPYGDHRIAMAFYPMEVLGIVKVENKEIVSKSFPNFYQQF